MPFPLAMKHSLFVEARQPLDQALAIVDVAGLAGIVDAQGAAAEDDELLGRHLGIDLPLEFLPEVLVGLAAIEAGLRQGCAGGKDEDDNAAGSNLGDRPESM